MTIEELNEAIKKGHADDIVMVSEARQVKALSRIADKIAERKSTKVVLVAGASSAGKTTTAKRLVTQLAVNGIASVSLSTDDYFVGDALNPRDEDGNLDYETVECVDRERISADIMALVEGREIREHRFDFVKHAPYDKDATIALPKGGVVILEGIHALNPVLLPGVSADSLYRVFVEPVGQPTVFAKTRLSSRHGRLLRRVVRDNRYRKMSPIDTFTMWPRVVAGEKKWIDPFKPIADDTFDSALDYELAVLKPYAEGLLVMAVSKMPENVEARGLLTLLSAVEAMGPTKVPGDSILRETIGGSLLEY